MRSWILIALLALAFPAAAESPGGHFYFGGGLAWSVPLNMTVREQRQTLAVSVDLTWEWQSAFLGLTLAHGANFGLDNGDASSGGTPWDAVALHAAFLPWSSRWASFYIGGGLGIMFVGFRKTDEEFPTTFFHWDSGAALLAEAGLLFFRESRWGRLSLSAQVFVPLFTVFPDSAPAGQTISIFTLGLRAQL